MSSPDAEELKTIYARRFRENQSYRQRVWKILVRHVFQQYVPADGAVLDLGCGYGEFINTVEARTKYGMDLNPASAEHLSTGVTMLRQDCSAHWNLPDSALDVVFTSNFFEHLPNKDTLGRTLQQARRCLKPGGHIIAMGPNIKFLPGAYWDFWDHYLPLTEKSLSEGLETNGFAIKRSECRFLPYTMVGGRQYPDFFLVCYLKMPWVWQFLGKQFLVIATRPAG
jgi:SAM-dependent methyltransferase